MSLQEVVNYCNQCGRAYVNFCVTCEKVRREEAVEGLMEKYDLSLDRLVSELAAQIVEGNFPALKLAIEMRSMKPPTRTDVTSGGQPLAIDDKSKQRILEKLDVIKQRGG